MVGSNSPILPQGSEPNEGRDREQVRRACAVVALRAHPLTDQWGWRDYKRLLKIGKATYFRDLAIALEYEHSAMVQSLPSDRIEGG